MWKEKVEGENGEDGEEKKGEEKKEEEKGRKSFSLLVRIRRSGSAAWSGRRIIHRPDHGCIGLMDQIINYGTGMGIHEKTYRWIERENSR